jgi:hypothetical protein
MAERLVAGRPISLSTKVAACVRRFETPTALNDGRTEAKEDVPMLGLRLMSKSYRVTIYLITLYSSGNKSLAP